MSGNLLKPITLGVENPAYSADENNPLSLPGTWYWTQEHFEQEKRKIFYRSWMLVGFDIDVKEPGDYITTSILDQPVMVVRGEDGTLRGFYNVCQHRGHLLLEGKGNAKRIRCPFHSWNYQLNGELRSAPNSENVPNFSCSDYSLTEIRVEEFCRMVFVNLDPDAEALATMVPGLKEEIYGIVPTLDSLHFARHDIIDIQANWKFIFDGLECYHCPFIHPGVMNSKDDYMTQEVSSVEHEYYSSHLFKGNRDVIDGKRAKPKPAWAEDIASYDLNLWYLWPNLMIMSHPGKANLKIAHAWPSSPTQTTRYIDHFLTTPEPTDVDIAQITRHREVFNQDIVAMVSQQAGVKALGYKQGRLMLDREHSWRTEHATHHFQGLVAAAIEKP